MTEEVHRDGTDPYASRYEYDPTRLLSYPPDDPLYAGGPTIEEYLASLGIDYLQARGGYPHPGDRP